MSATDPGGRSVKTLRLYTRRGCHLCELLEDQLQPLVSGRARVETIDIDTDIELKKRYGLRIPVLACADRELSGYPLQAEAVESYLAGCIADTGEIANTRCPVGAS